MQCGNFFICLGGVEPSPLLQRPLNCLLQSPFGIIRSGWCRKVTVEQSMECKIWGSHGGDYEEWCFLGCYALWLLLFLRSVRRLLVAALLFLVHQFFVTLMKEAPRSSETSVLIRDTRRKIPEDTILQSMECLAGETEVTGGSLPQSRLVHQKSHMTNRVAVVGSQQVTAVRYGMPIIPPFTPQACTDLYVHLFSVILTYSDSSQSL
jgi:hypothetical protein